MMLRILPLAALALVASCGGDGGPTVNSNLSGSMSFSYTGGGGGNFNVSGAAPALSANIGAQSWAAGYRDVAANYTGAYGVRARSGGRYDMMIVGIARTTVGSSSVSPTCDPELGEECSGFFFILNASEADQNYDFICFAETGSMAISSLNSDNTRATGTFTGSGSCINSTGAVSAFTATNGTFDVRLLSESQFPQ